MALTAGTRLGPYEILSPLGAGGMGEVYRARDTKLNRDVAIKALPAAYESDPERLARFRREAEVLALLNHPNIAAIFGMEHSGDAECLVLELVEGETLADRLKRGPLAVDEALTVARQIAEALEVAHDKGIVHRDLKPANVKITPSGSIKVLDFGLAKLLEVAGAPTELSQSPTLSAGLTMGGVILGTAAYMSPEQARGRPVDRRTDIWALGCLLYHLLTGRQAFGGETTTDIIGAIIKTDPDWRALPEDAACVRSLLRRCLQKDLNKRLQYVADARIELEDAIAATPQADDRQDRVPTLAGRLWAVAGWILAAAAVTVAAWSLAGRPPTLPVMPTSIERMVITVPSGQPVALTRHAVLGLARKSIDISPDGSTLVYTADVGRHTQLYLRRLDSFEVKPIPKTEGAFYPFFSPDGRWIGFFSEDKLEKVPAQGGEPIVLCDARNGVGGSWSPAGTIIFADSEGSRVVSVSAEGGPTRSVSSQGAPSQSPVILPDGKSALLTVEAPGGGWQIVVLALDTGRQRVLIEGGTEPRFVNTGHILFIRGSSLMAARFDLEGLTMTGSPEVVLEGIRTEGSGHGQFTVSRTGTLIYVAGGAGGAGTLGWADRRGGFVPLPVPAQVYGNFRISHDGRHLAVEVYSPLSDVWIYDFERAAMTRLTVDGKNGNPAWSLDDKRVAFRSQRSGVSGILLKAVDGSAAEEQLISGVSLAPDRWSPDGKYLVFTEPHQGTSWDISILPLDGDRKPRPFLNSQFSEWGPVFSPDGRYIAYISDSSGRYEIYVQPFPEKGKRWQVSTDGGEEPVWSRDGKELFYRYGQKWMAVDVQTAPNFSAGKPRLLFEGPYMNVPYLSYDIARDGKRFLVIKPSDETSATTELRVVLNWFEELKRHIPSPAGRSSP